MITLARCGCTSSTCSCTIIVEPTDCILPSITGNGSSENNYIISAVPVVDPTAGNLLTCEGTGLRADIAHIDTNCVYLDGAGTVGDPLEATLMIAPAVSGWVKCTATGLSVVVDPDLTNQLEGGSAGLYVPPAAGFTVDDSDCIAFTGAGTLADPVLAELIISPATSGCITCDTDGLELRFSPLGGISCGPSGITASFPETLIVAVGDETTVITTGTAKVTFRMPFAMTLTSVRASLTTASSSGNPTVDINETGTTILSTKLSIDATEKTSTTAAVPPVISDSALADDAEITIDIDTAGTGAAGLKVYFIGTRT